MSNTRILLTAGYDKAPHVLTLVELLRREKVEIAGLLVVTPYSVKRLRSLIRQRGPRFLKSAVQRLMGRNKKSNGARHQDALHALMEENDIKDGSLRSWARTYGVPYQTVKSLNDSSSIDFVNIVQPDWVVYGGGGILHNAFIDSANGRILNAHAGPLPDIRGMNACEWSMLLGHKTAVTIHLINRGIDTGGVISTNPFPVRFSDTIDEIRSRSVATGVEALYKTLLNPPETVPEPTKEAGASRQCFTMAPAIRELLEMRLRKQAITKSN